MISLLISLSNKTKNRIEKRRKLIFLEILFVYRVLSSKHLLIMRAGCSLSIISTRAFYGMQDELCQLCVMDARSDEPAKREATSSITSIAGNRGEEGEVEESGASDNEQHEMPPTPDTVPITTSTAAAMQKTCDEIDAASTVQIESTEKSNNDLRTSELVKRGATDEAASFNT